MPALTTRRYQGTELGTDDARMVYASRCGPDPAVNTRHKGVLLGTDDGREVYAIGECGTVQSAGRYVATKIGTDDARDVYAIDCCAAIALCHTTCTVLPTTYRFDLAGITQVHANCTACAAKFNQTHDLSVSPDCYWSKTFFPTDNVCGSSFNDSINLADQALIGIGTAGTIILFFQISRNVGFDRDISVALYEKSASAWDCLGANIMTLNTTPIPGYLNYDAFCASWPATITVEPA